MKKFKDSYFVKTLELMKKNPKNVFLIILFDILFLLSISIFYRLIEFLFSKTSTQISTIIVIIYLVLTLLYYLILILIYSFFKYLVLNSIKSLFEHSKVDFKRLKNFYLLNLLIFIVFFIIFLFLNSIFLMSAKQEYASYIFSIINFPLFLILYIFINISHTLFSENLNIKETVKNTFNIIAKVTSYIGIFLTNIIAIIIYFIIFYFIGLILKATIFKGYLAPIKYYNIYTIIFSIITTIFFYLIIFFNRIYFYNIIRNKK